MSGFVAVGLGLLGMQVRPGEAVEEPRVGCGERSPVVERPSQRQNEHMKKSSQSLHGDFIVRIHTKCEVGSASPAVLRSERMGAPCPNRAGRGCKWATASIKYPWPIPALSGGR